ncbi:DUF354 domain-containing protein [Ideonella sp. DXS22W]|uniref:DUF354 domain-containing protein n=1 Tax=Pseudaquabacterium inlustre TaxID=2984192 RepID=A0ABU9CE18_9BURK
MKVWFDLSNSPHINLFAHLIRDLEASGHEVVISCRPLANTIDLLDLHGFRYEVVGEHYGAKFSHKVMGYPIRVMQLARWLRPQRIDVAVSQSSFHSPVVAKLLGVRSIYMNDNEHALGNVPSFLAAGTIMVPEFLSDANLRRQLANLRKVRRYPGVKEGIYLWRLQDKLDAKGQPAAQRTARPVVYVRPEPWTAQYYRGDRNFMDDLLLGIKHEAQVVLLPRGKDQGRHYRDARFDGITIIDTALDIADIAPACDLFIGAGGTMTREMAVLGVPTISVYQDELLDVDRFLLAERAFEHRPNLTANETLEFLRVSGKRAVNRALLEKGKMAYQQVRNEILRAG